MKLYNRDGTETPPRPSFESDANDIINFACGNAGFYEDGDADAIQRHFYEHIGSYELGRNLDLMEAWCVDRKVIGMLDDLISIFSDELKRRVDAWFSDNDIVRPFEDGDALDVGVIKRDSDSGVAKFFVFAGTSGCVHNFITVKWEDAELKED